MAWEKAPSHLLLANSEFHCRLTMQGEGVTAVRWERGGKNLDCWLRKFLFRKRFNFMNKILEKSKCFLSTTKTCNLNQKRSSSALTWPVCRSHRRQESCTSGSSPAMEQIPPSWPLASGLGPGFTLSGRPVSQPQVQHSRWSDPPWRDDRCRGVGKDPRCGPVVLDNRTGQDLGPP